MSFALTTYSSRIVPRKYAVKSRQSDRRCSARYTPIPVVALQAIFPALQTYMISSIVP